MIRGNPSGKAPLMRLKLSLAIAAAAVSSLSAVFLAAPSTNASACPPGTIGKPVKLPTGQVVNVCVPGQQCDPGPCPSTAPPARD